MLIIKSQFLYSFLIVVFLAACGGGSSSNTSPGGGFSYTPTSLSFSAQVDADAPVSQIITLTALGTATEIPDVSFTPDVLDSALLNVVSSDSAEITVTVKSPVLLGVGTHATSVSIDSSEGIVTIPVIYTVTPVPPGNPEVHYISPYIVNPGETRDVNIRGSGFSRFDNSNLPTITIGSQPVTNVVVVSDSMIQVTAPSLSVGDHALEISGSGVVFTSQVNLKVIEDQFYATTSILTSGEKSKLIFDKERRAVYVVNTTSDSLERYTFQGGTNWTLDLLSLSGLSDAALSPDGGSLVIVDGSSFYKVDPADATMLAGTAVNAPLDTLNSVDRITGSSGEMISVGNNQWSPVFTYNVLTDGTDKLNFLNSSQISVNYSIYQPQLFRVPDGGEIYFGESGISTSRLYVLDTRDNTIAETGLSVNSFSGYYSLSTTKDKSRMLVNGKDIYNADFTALLGSLPDIYTRGVISPDGNTAYVFIDFTGVQSNILRAYNISTPSTPAQIGSDVLLTNGPGMRAQMEISDDGNTLFLSGTDSLEIIDLTTFRF